MTQETEIITRTLEFLGPNGENWIKDPLTWRQRQDEVCVMQALSRCAPMPCNQGVYRRLYVALADVVQEQFPDRIPVRALPDKRSLERQARSSVFRFNDHPDTVFPEVVSALEKTRVRLEEADTL